MGYDEKVNGSATFRLPDYAWIETLCTFSMVKWAFHGARLQKATDKSAQ